MVVAGEGRAAKAITSIRLCEEQVQQMSVLLSAAALLPLL